jgi:hypothetical protein
MPDQEAIAAADKLGARLGELTESLQVAKVYGKRNRRLIWMLLVSLCLDVALTAGLAVGLFQVRAANTAARVARQTNINLCKSSNVARAQQIGLWTYVLDLSGKPRTPQEQVTVRKFTHHLHVIFQPRNCQDINPAVSGGR